MKGMLPSLMGIMLCTLASHSSAADLTVPLSTKTGEELHAAVTDMPDIIDMSHADPKTWHSLPPTAQGSRSITAPNRLMVSTGRCVLGSDHLAGCYLDLLQR